MRYQTNQKSDASSAIHLRRIQAEGGAAGKYMWEVFVIFIVNGVKKQVK